jgi:23S rRNA (pseudouridine1915-N3)-methyltransferase
MRVLLAAVGRARSDPAKALFDHYAARLTWPLAVREITVRGGLPAPQLKAREAEKLLAAVPEGAVIVALDEGGTALTSEAFARRLEEWRDRGAKDLAILIGGSHGLDATVRERADLVLSLGPMTWPHLLARALLAEQLYRAQTILAGHPYHRA